MYNSKELQTVHEATASQGQSQAPEDLDNVLLHFVCFVRSKDGELVELDGSGGRTGPLNRGKKVASQEDLLPVAVEYVKDNYVSSSLDIFAAESCQHRDTDVRTVAFLLQHRSDGIKPG